MRCESVSRDENHTARPEYKHVHAALPQVLLLLDVLHRGAAIDDTEATRLGHHQSHQRKRRRETDALQARGGRPRRLDQRWCATADDYSLSRMSLATAKGRFRQRENGPFSFWGRGVSCANEVVGA